MSGWLGFRVLGFRGFSCRFLVPDLSDMWASEQSMWG